MSGPNPRERGERKSSALPSPRDMCLGHPRARPRNRPRTSPLKPQRAVLPTGKVALGRALGRGTAGGQPHPTAALPIQPAPQTGLSGDSRLHYPSTWRLLQEWWRRGEGMSGNCPGRDRNASPGPDLNGTCRSWAPEPLCSPFIHSRLHSIVYSFSTNSGPGTVPGEWDKDASAGVIHNNQDSATTEVVWMNG